MFIFVLAVNVQRTLIRQTLYHNEHYKWHLILSVRDLPHFRLMHRPHPVCTFTLLTCRDECSPLRTLRGSELERIDESAETMEYERGRTTCNVRNNSIGIIHIIVRVISTCHTSLQLFFHATHSRN